MSDQNKKLLDDEALSAAAGGVQSEIDVAFDVIDGKYGNGDARRIALQKAGYNYDTIQNLVNNMLLH